MLEKINPWGRQKLRCRETQLLQGSPGIYLFVYTVHSLTPPFYVEKSHFLVLSFDTLRKIRSEQPLMPRFGGGGDLYYARLEPLRFEPLRLEPLRFEPARFEALRFEALRFEDLRFED